MKLAYSDKELNVTLDAVEADDEHYSVVLNVTGKIRQDALSNLQRALAPSALAAFRFVIQADDEADDDENYDMRPMTPEEASELFDEAVADLG